MKRVCVAVCLAVLMLPSAVAAAQASKKGAVTDESVRKAIEKGIKYLVKQQQKDGTWKEKKHHHAQTACGHSELALLTLIYTGEHPNREYVSKALDAVIARPLDYTYAVCCRVMALAHVQNKLIGKKRDLVRTALKRDVKWLVNTQGPNGGWGYTGTSGGRTSRVYEDLSNSQLVILALREASLAGVEIPRSTWQRAQAKYFRMQQGNGSWSYIEGDRDQGYGSMTAAGLASIFITLDNLDVASGCPCSGGRSGSRNDEIDRRIDKALGWLEKNFKANTNPNGKARRENRIHYWQYSVERVGAAAGYKYFGGHDWFKEIAGHLLKSQQGDGSWNGNYGQLVSTCFAVMSLFKGRGPILFNKLEFDGLWNNHRRDTYNLTSYISKNKEQICHWQIVNLKAPVAELHDAPILFITPEAPPPFDEKAKAKLRRFTDTGGTILLEASCGNANVRKWFREFIAEVWPEWKLKPLGPDHYSFIDPYNLHKRPEVLGLNDGLRTFLFYAADDISCLWHQKAYASRGYLFNWGINLVAYATDAAPLRAKLAAREPKPDDRYKKQSVAAGPGESLRVARVKHPGNWSVGVRYKGFDRLKKYLQDKAALSVEVNEGGVAPRGLGACDVAYLTGSDAFDISAADMAALKAFAAKGGFLWFEAAGGALAFNGALRKLAQQANWQVTLLAKGHPLISGRMGGPKGFNLTANVRFRRALKVVRTGRPHAELHGVFDGDRMIGVYSPLDIVFSATPYQACMCRGYQSPDAQAVATNILLYATSGRPQRQAVVNERGRATQRLSLGAWAAKHAVWLSLASARNCRHTAQVAHAK